MKRDVKEDSETLEILNFNFKEEITTCAINKDRCSIDEVFAAYSKSKKIAFFNAFLNIGIFLPFMKIISIFAFNKKKQLIK